MFPRRGGGGGGGDGKNTEMSAVEGGAKQKGKEEEERLLNITQGRIFRAPTEGFWLLFCPCLFARNFREFRMWLNEI